VYDLAIPDTYCSPDDKPGYHCPKGMKCMSIDMPKNSRGFNGFDELRKMHLSSMTGFFFHSELLKSEKKMLSLLFMGVMDQLNLEFN